MSEAPPQKPVEHPPKFPKNRVLRHGEITKVASDQTLPKPSNKPEFPKNRVLKHGELTKR